VADDDAPALGRPQRLLVLSRLEPEKAVDVAIAGFATSALSSDGWTLVIAGEGSQRPALEALADELGVADAVSFVGFVADPRALLHRSSALVAPTPREGLGLAVLEAMATATPVVAAEGGAHPEVLGSEGVLVPPADVDAFARAIRELAARGSEGRASMGAALRHRQRTIFGREAHLEGLERLYRSVTGG
jgi:glycosyltransferase involved in cell wall biosynthesis